MSVTLSLSELEANDPRSPRRGKERRFLCPLCGDGKPRDAAHRSIAVNTLNGAWICHRCGEKGLLTEFWTDRPKQGRQERTNLGLVRAFALPPRLIAAEQQKSAEVGQQWLEMWEAAVPLTGGDGASYLERRGIPERVAAEAGIRFSTRWYGRSAVVFPIRNRQGEVVAVNGRFIDEGVRPKTQTAGPKSLGVFTTPNAFSTSPIAVVEAPLDALSLWLCGVAAVALVGTSWPDWLPSALAFKPVLVATDADVAGDEAAAKLAFALKGRGARPFRLRPDGGKDWNELLGVGGVEALRERLAGYSQTADDEIRVNASWDSLMSGHQEEADFIASLVEDALTRELYRARLRRKLKELKAA